MEIVKPNLSFEHWRKKILQIFCVIVILIFIVEVAVFFILRPFGLLDEGFSDFQYAIKYIALPTMINIAIVFSCHWINKMNIRDSVKNLSIPLAFSLLAAVIAFIHYDVTAVLTVFTLPVFLTILFGKRRTTGVITFVSGILLVLSTIHSATYPHSIYFYLNATVAFTLLIAAYLISNVLITYNKANSDYIYSSYKTQISLHEQARNDSLTGLYNQRTFHSLLSKSLEKARHGKAPMSLAIIDLDGFKEINDTYGHLAGDQILQHFTHLIKQQCSEGDAYISRYGGDEFAIIFPKASKELAYLKLESLRQRCKHVPSSVSQTDSISFSAGISHYLGGELTESVLFHQADSALYQAKENGKGQTIIYTY